jgi:aryl-alcohol dehydrogenase-like predicted oxidoreductase
MATAPGGTLRLADDLTISRMGYGAMQLAGPGVFGPPKDHDEAIAVLREAVALGVTHIDTSDFYGPYVTNQLIKEALHPYPANLRIVTKVGARRDEKGAWLPASSRDQLVAAVHSNLKNLAVDALDVVNLRIHGHGGADARNDDSIAERFSALAELQRQGLIRHLGVSNATAGQLAEAQSIAPVVTVQNLYNIVNRQDDALVDLCVHQNIAYTPYFPLGGFSPLQSAALHNVAMRLGVNDQQVALAWLLQRSPTIVVIPGTSSVAHLRANIASAALSLPADAISELDSIGAKS